MRLEFWIFHFRYRSESFDIYCSDALVIRKLRINSPSDLDRWDKISLTILSHAGLCTVFSTEGGVTWGLSEIRGSPLLWGRRRRSSKSPLRNFFICTTFATVYWAKIQLMHIILSKFFSVFLSLSQSFSIFFINKKTCEEWKRIIKIEKIKNDWKILRKSMRKNNKYWWRWKEKERKIEKHYEK